jgi:toxin ParE1/3/4
MTRLVVAAEAESDTATILSYLEREAGVAIALQYGQRFEQTIDRLVSMPDSGAPRPALGARVRIGVVAPYVLIYEYSREDDTLTLLRILHGRRHLARILSRE